jgi:hypothetical protein
MSGTLSINVRNISNVSPVNDLPTSVNITDMLARKPMGTITLPGT